MRPPPVVHVVVVLTAAMASSHGSLQVVQLELEHPSTDSEQECVTFLCIGERA